MRDIEERLEESDERNLHRFLEDNRAQVGTGIAIFTYKKLKDKDYVPERVENAEDIIREKLGEYIEEYF